MMNFNQLRNSYEWLDDDFMEKVTDKDHQEETKEFIKSNVEKLTSNMHDLMLGLYDKVKQRAQNEIMAKRQLFVF